MLPLAIASQQPRTSRCPRSHGAFDAVRAIAHYALVRVHADAAPPDAVAAAPHLLTIPQATIDEERAIFEAKLQKLADEANRKLELRTRELERTKDLRREECDAAEKKERDEEGAASSATLAKHRDILDSIDQEIEGAREAVEKQRKAYEGEQRGFFDRHESLQIQVIADRRISAITNIRQIRKETQAKIRGDENKWQNDAARWLSTGRRKVELKKREDADMEAAKRRRGQ